MPTTKRRNPRVLVSEHLAEIKRAASRLQNVTKTLSTGYDYSTGARRRPQDYAENRLSYWRGVSQEAENLFREADALHLIAQGEIARLEAEQHGGAR